MLGKTSASVVVVVVVVHISSIVRKNIGFSSSSSSSRSEVDDDFCYWYLFSNHYTRECIHTGAFTQVAGLLERVSESE